MQIIHLLLLLTLFLIGGHVIWNWPNPTKKLRYKHPEDAVGVGPKWEEHPQLHYMWIWKEDTRLNMEFRNLPGVVIRCDRRVVPELAESLKKISADETSTSHTK